MIENTSLPSDAEALGSGCCTPMATHGHPQPANHCQHIQHIGKKWNKHVRSCSLMLCSLRFPPMSSPRIARTRCLDAVCRSANCKWKGSGLRRSKSPALVDGVPIKRCQKKVQQCPAREPSSPSAVMLRSQLVRFRNSSIATVAGTLEREVISYNHHLIDQRSATRSALSKVLGGVIMIFCTPAKERTTWLRRL